MLRVLLILIIATARMDAATIAAASSSRADVATAITSASDGDTVTIPTGRSDWTSTLTISKAITLQGNGTNNTIITSGVTDGTPIIIWELVANKNSRMTGIQFTNGTVAASFGQAIKVSGSNGDSRKMRIDNCLFNRLTRGAIYIDTAYGLNDYCTFIAPAAGVTAFYGYVKGSSFGGTQGQNLYGDGSVAADANFGTDAFWFVENCYLTNEYSNHLTMIDCQAGGRYVFRHNTVGGGVVESHGTEAQRERSGRAFEVYSNSFVGFGTQDSVTYARGGEWVIYNNSVTNYGTPKLAVLNNRAVESSCCQPFGGADGRNPWDSNDPSSPFVTGTCSSSGSLTMTDSGKSWTVNQWRGYTVRRTSGVSVSSMTRSGSTVTVTTAADHGFSTSDGVSVFGADQQEYNNAFGITVTGARTFTFTIASTPTTPATGTILCALGGFFSEISANTATELTFRSSGFPAYVLSFTAGDTYEINKVTHYIDMVGRVKGSALTGDNPSLPGGWNDQTTAPCYEWGNATTTGTDIDFSVTGYVIAENTHFINDTVKPGYTAFQFPYPWEVGRRSAGMRGLRIRR